MGVDLRCITPNQVYMWDASMSTGILLFWHEWHLSVLTDQDESVHLLVLSVSK